MIKKREIFGWAMFDFANSGYTTVVLTAIFNTYFIAVIAKDIENGAATLLWTITIAIANAIVLFASPLLGAIADFSCNKKRFLFISTFFCTVFTALLFFTGPGDILLACSLIILSSLMFYIGESLIGAFLPEISSNENIGKISGYGWALGYIGGLIVLGICLVYVNSAKTAGLSAEEFVPVTMLIVAACFAVAALPTFFLLKERCIKKELTPKQSLFKTGYKRLQNTWRHSHQYQDLFRFLICLFTYHCGINTVIVIAAIYAQEVMQFTTEDTILLILIVNISAAAGAFAFGIIQDRIGVKKTLSFTLCIWILAMLLAFFTTSLGWFWFVANLIGIALGSSQSAGRSMIGLFSPAHHNGEFFGLWGLAIRLAAIVGPISYGLMAYATKGDHRLALLSTILFFIIGLILLSRVDENRGKQAALN
ncbi:MAG: MFS transporter [Gammaproteobacteria bacterium]|nr:MFS transporter [Gammaproteobacteria bacterium]